jgi:hypothetical protein
VPTALAERIGYRSELTMGDQVKIAFERQIVILALHDILPSKMLPPAVKESTKYRRIAASVAQLDWSNPLSSHGPKAAVPICF